MRKFIAGYEILGGILVLGITLLGIMFIIMNHGQTNIWTGTLFLSLIVAVTFGLINLIGGIKLWQNRNSGYALSIIAQLIQLISVHTPNFRIIFYTVLGLILNFGKAGLAFLWGIGASYLMSFASQPVETTYVGINIVALILLILIIVLYQRKKQIVS